MTYEHDKLVGSKFWGEYGESGCYSIHHVGRDVVTRKSAHHLLTVDTGNTKNIFICSLATAEEFVVAGASLNVEHELLLETQNLTICYVRLVCNPVALSKEHQDKVRYL